MITTSTNRTNTNRQPKTFWQSFEYRFCWGGERTICAGAGGGQRTEQHTLARTTHCVTMCTFLWARTHVRTHPLAHSQSLVLFSTTALSLSPSLTQNQPKDRPTHSKSLKSTKKIQILFSAVIQPEKKKQHSYTHTRVRTQALLWIYIHNQTNAIALPPHYMSFTPPCSLRTAW